MNFSDELASAMAEVSAGATAGFGHREHIHLAYLAARRYGPGQAPGVMCDWIRQIAQAHGVPDKYHATMTIAWAQLVADHVSAGPDGEGSAGFEAFAGRYPALLDKTLLSRHYSAVTLGSAAARAHWVEPDLAGW